MSKWYMIVCDIVKEMYFLFLEEDTGGNGVNGCIAPTLIKESSILIKCVKVVEIRRGPKPIKVADFKVGPLK